MVRGRGAGGYKWAVERSEKGGLGIDSANAATGWARGGRGADRIKRGDGCSTCTVLDGRWRGGAISRMRKGARWAMGGRHVKRNKMRARSTVYTSNHAYVSNTIISYNTDKTFRQLPFYVTFHVSPRSDARHMRHASACLDPPVSYIFLRRFINGALAHG